jgi:alkanesulfonate monooxygenase SsuD/methylene tetrahydromethanopterin reductase-like flavin-dependent oxidoreductase (luciferase family)
MSTHRADLSLSSTSRPLIVALPGARETSPSTLAYDPYDIDTYTDYARQLEKWDVTALLIGDTPLDTAELNTPEAISPPLAMETFTVASYIAVRTERIGLITTVNVNYREPFALARLLASLDHVSGGRSGWTLSIAETGNAPENHQQRASSVAARVERAMESLSVMSGLLDTWEPDAFIRDKASGQFVDAGKVRFLNHIGPLFRVAGPLNVAPSPQRFPPLFLSVTEEPALAALSERADALIVSEHGLDATSHRSSFSRKKDERTDPQRILRRIQPFLADSRGAAEVLSNQQAPRHGDNRFIGTWEDWCAEITRSHDMGAGRAHDGLVLEFPDRFAFDLDYARRVITGISRTGNASEISRHQTAPASTESTQGFTDNTLSIRLGLNRTPSGHTSA